MFGYMISRILFGFILFLNLFLCLWVEWRFLLLVLLMRSLLFGSVLVVLIVLIEVGMGILFVFVSVDLSFLLMFVGGIFLFVLIVLLFLIVLVNLGRFRIC